MTRPDAEALAAALEAATGRQWIACVMGFGAIWLRPADLADRLVWLDCWPRDGARRVVLRESARSPGMVWRDVPQGRGWPERAAAAVVAMLGER